MHEYRITPVQIVIHVGVCLPVYLMSGLISVCFFFLMLHFYKFEGTLEYKSTLIIFDISRIYKGLITDLP